MTIGIIFLLLIIIIILIIIISNYIEKKGGTEQEFIKLKELYDSDINFTINLSSYFTKIKNKFPNDWQLLLHNSSKCRIEFDSATNFDEIVKIILQKATLFYKIIKNAKGKLYGLRSSSGLITWKLDHTTNIIDIVNKTRKLFFEDILHFGQKNIKYLFISSSIINDSVRYKDTIFNVDDVIKLMISIFVEIQNFIIWIKNKYSELKYKNILLYEYPDLNISDDSLYLINNPFIFKFKFEDIFNEKDTDCNFLKILSNDGYVNIENLYTIETPIKKIELRKYITQKCFIAIHELQRLIKIIKNDFKPINISYMYFERIQQYTDLKILYNELKALPVAPEVIAAPEAIVAPVAVPVVAPVAVPIAAPVAVVAPVVAPEVIAAPVVVPVVAPDPGEVLNIFLDLEPDPVRVRRIRHIPIEDDYNYYVNIKSPKPIEEFNRKYYIHYEIITTTFIDNKINIIYEKELNNKLKYPDNTIFLIGERQFEAKFVIIKDFIERCLKYQIPKDLIKNVLINRILDVPKYNIYTVLNNKLIPWKP
jgi:hypothetical protein